MKRLTFLVLILISLHQWSEAQLPNSNLNRICVETLEGYLSVNPGEFQVEYNLLPNASTHSMSTYYNYVYVARNSKTGMTSIYSNGATVIPLDYTARTFRIANNWNECVFAVKYFEDDVNGVGYGVETIYAYGVLQNLCDSIISMTNDGYVYKLNDVYYYSTYKDATTQSQVASVVWPEKRTYKEADSTLLSAGALGCRLSDGDVYHCSIGKDKDNLHYYYLYRDQYMPYTVLVVDGKVVELYGDYADESFRLKYSYDGWHWMAVADDRIWVDGKMKSVEGYTISDFMITNDGDYIYKASKKGEEEKGETLVMNGEIIRRQVIIGHFALNAQQKLRFHFLAAGQWYVYENGQINSLNKESNSILYTDDLIDNLAIDKYSYDGMHKLSYVTGQKGVEIDGVQVTKSVPFQVVYDKEEKCFRWNAIETNKEGKTDLVIYKYSL